VILHSFIGAAFFTPVVAGWLADSYFGKFPTIVVLTVVYIIGQALLTLAALLPPNASVSAEIPILITAILGLSFTALGTGFKSSISALGADCVEPQNWTTYFNFFYLAINLGSFFSLLIAPLISHNEGYWLSFLIPTLLMIAALFIFMIGFQMYNHVQPKGKNVVIWVAGVILAAFKHHNRYTREQNEFHATERSEAADDEDPTVQQRLLQDEDSSDEDIMEEANVQKASDDEKEVAEGAKDTTTPQLVEGEQSLSEKSSRAKEALHHRRRQTATLVRKDGRLRSHFLNAAALAGYSKHDIATVQCIIAIVIQLSPIIIYWSIFEQFSSRWVFQGRKMRQDFFGLTIYPEQMQVINPICILIFVPIFDRLVYKIIKLSPLQKISIGFLFIITAYTISIVLEIFVTTYPGKVHILVQTVQFILLSISEVLVSVTGLEFAYSEAPTSMKSFMSAFYLMCVSFGNIILVISTLILDKLFNGVRYRHVFEMTFFIVFLLLGFILFILLSLSYEYKKGTKLTATLPLSSDMIDSQGNPQGTEFEYDADATARDADDFSFDEEHSTGADESVSQENFSSDIRSTSVQEGNE